MLEKSNPETEPKRTKKKRGHSYPNRLLSALAGILEDPDASIAERLQAAKLSLEAIPLRPSPRRKTDKEKAIIEALKGTKKPGVFKGHPVEEPPKD